MTKQNTKLVEKLINQHKFLYEALSLQLIKNIALHDPEITKKILTSMKLNKEILSCLTDKVFKVDNENILM